MRNAKQLDSKSPGNMSVGQVMNNGQQNISTMQLKHRSPVHAFSHDGATGFDQSVVEIVPTTYQIVW